MGDVATYVTESRKAQGLPEKLEDPATLERLAVLIAARARKAGSE